MTANPTIEDFEEVREALSLPHTALVEKDYYVAKALAALVGYTTGPVRLVFGGGTALCRAHGLILRMSEDIDLKIVSDNEMSRPERKKFRDSVRDTLAAAGFLNVTVKSFDDNRTQVFELEYPTVAPKVGSLRPHVKLEISSWPAYLPPVDRSISSFVSQAYEREPEIASFPCADVLETAAEKFVALTRRIGEERAAGDERDKTLLRHIYDLHQIGKGHDLGALAELIKQIIPSDQKTRGGKFLAYGEDPNREIRAALAALRDDPAYPEAFDEFQRDMVYGERADYQDCLATLESIWVLVQPSDEARRDR